MHFCSGGRVADQSFQRVIAAPQNICRKNIHLRLHVEALEVVTPFQTTGNFNIIANQEGYPLQYKLT